MNLSDALKELEKRRTPEVSIRQNFEKAASESLKEHYKKLPSYLIAEHDFQNGVTIVRDKYLPQVGITIKFEDAGLLENKIRYLDDNKRDAYTLLNRYDIHMKPVKNSQDRILHHPIYAIPDSITKSYEAGMDPSIFSSQIANFAKEVFERDDLHKQKLAKVLALPFINDAYVSSSSRRGMRTNTLSCETPGRGNLVIEFTSYSSKRLKGEDGIPDARVSEKTIAEIEHRLNGLNRAHHKIAEMRIA